MKRINIKEYHTSMGTLIDVNDPLTFYEYHESSSINIPLSKLLFNYKMYLNKGEKYYIICKKGIKSRKAVSILEFYGYDVTQVYY